MPAHLRPDAPATSSAARGLFWADIVPHWDAVQRDLAERYHLDLYDPATLARPWPGVRTLIFGLLREPSRLATALGGDRP